MRVGAAPVAKRDWRERGLGGHIAAFPPCGEEAEEENGRHRRRRAIARAHVRSMARRMVTRTNMKREILKHGERAQNTARHDKTAHGDTLAHTGRCVHGVLQDEEGAPRTGDETTAKAKSHSSAWTSAASLMLAHPSPILVLNAPGRVSSSRALASKEAAQELPRLVVGDISNMRYTCVVPKSDNQPASACHEDSSDCEEPPAYERQANGHAERCVQMIQATRKHSVRSAREPNLRNNPGRPCGTHMDLSKCHASSSLDNGLWSRWVHVMGTSCRPTITTTGRRARGTSHVLYQVAQVGKIKNLEAFRRLSDLRPGDFAFDHRCAQRWGAEGSSRARCAHFCRRCEPPWSNTRAVCYLRRPPQRYEAGV